jgi:pimeloyl-ACP methyl ester carboxylesterase
VQYRGGAPTDLSVVHEPNEDRMSSVDSTQRIGHVVKRVAVVVLSFATLLTIAGAAMEAIARGTTKSKFPPPGRLVDVGGRRMQIDCRGQGTPTVVLESGLDFLGSLSWAAVHDSIARTTRVCAYSRAGIMWSDPSPLAFSSERVASDLRKLLDRAGESAPFVMVGHSIGGPYVTQFTKAYGEAVAGLVFVDASHPDQIARVEKATGMSMTPPTGTLSFGAAMARTGLVRALAGDVAPRHAPEATRAASSAFVPTSLASTLRETKAVHATLVSAQSSRALGSRPLVVLTAMAELSAAERESQHMTVSQEAKHRAAWKELQTDEATWSTRARQILVSDATHYIQFDRPDVVIAAVRDVVCAVRADRAVPCRP